MKNAVKKTAQWSIQLFFLLLVMVPATSSLLAATIVPPQVELGCPTPTSLTRTAITSSSISFSWSGSGISYQVYYVRLSDGYTSSVMTTGSTSMTILGLVPGAYKFYVASVCEDGSSDFIVAEDLIMG